MNHRRKLLLECNCFHHILVELALLLPHSNTSPDPTFAYSSTSLYQTDLHPDRLLCCSSQAYTPGIFISWQEAQEQSTDAKRFSSRKKAKAYIELAASLRTPIDRWISNFLGQAGKGVHITLLVSGVTQELWGPVVTRQMFSNWVKAMHATSKPCHYT